MGTPTRWGGSEEKQEGEGEEAGGQVVIRSTAEWRLMRGLERWEEGGEGKAAAEQTVTNVARVQTLTNAAEGKLMDQNVGLPEEWSPAEEKVSKHYSLDRR